MAEDKVSRERVERIVRKLDDDGNGEISVAEAKKLLCTVLQIPEEEVPDDHEDVVEFAGLTVEQMIDRLCEETEKVHVDQYYTILFPDDGDRVDPAANVTNVAAVSEPALDARAQSVRVKVEAIVKRLDADTNGEISAAEAKVTKDRTLIHMYRLCGLLTRMID